MGSEFLDAALPANPSLEDLSIFGGNLMYPPSLAGFTNLTGVHLRQPFASLPGAISLLQKLRILDCDFQGKMSLPFDITPLATLTGLAKLSLQSCTGIFVGCSLTGLASHALTSLDLDGSSLMSNSLTTGEMMHFMHLMWTRPQRGLPAALISFNRF